MPGQLLGCGSSIRRAAPRGTIDVTYTIASTVPSFRTRWVSPPSSTNPDPAATTSGVQVGSSARYNIRAPALTITRLGPGCECQPKDPPGTMTFCNIQTSDSPFVLMRACQLLERVFALISLNCAMPRTVLVTPCIDVASTVPPYAATVATTTRSASTNRIRIFPYLPGAFRPSGTIDV